MKTLIGHADLDAFYASVEQLDHPIYRGKPVIVGGNPRGRGVVSAASYEARKFGIRSAMPTAQAYRLCPHGIFLQTRFSRYRQLSFQFKAILNSLTPFVEPLSLDEAFMDLTENTLRSKDPFELADYVQNRVKKEIGLDVSLGIGPNKLIAKLASEIDKPRGLVVISPDQVLDFLAPLKLNKLWGVGKQTEKKLAKHNLHTIEQVREHSVAELTDLFGNFGQSLYNMARGIDSRPVSKRSASKSLGAERTFKSDISELKELERYLFSICLEVAKRAKSKKIKAKTLTLKYKNNQFESRTKSITLPEPLWHEDQLFHTGGKLLNEIDLGIPLRLLGISLSNFADESEHTTQLSLF